MYDKENKRMQIFFHVTRAKVEIFTLIQFRHSGGTFLFANETF